MSETAIRLMNTCIGLVGTGLSAALANASEAATIFAGTATGLYMIIQAIYTLVKIRERRGDGD